MSRARSWVSQVKPSPMTLTSTSSGKRSRNSRSPVSRRPLTNCTTPSLRPCPRQRIARPQAAVLLPLPVPVWTISRPFSSVFDGVEPVLRRLDPRHLLAVRLVDLGLASCCLAAVAGPCRLALPCCAVGRQLVEQRRARCCGAAARGRARSPRAKRSAISRSAAGLASAMKSRTSVVGEVGVVQRVEMVVLDHAARWRRRRTGSRPSRRSRRRPCSRGASRRRSTSD